MRAPQTRDLVWLTAGVVALGCNPSNPGAGASGSARTSSSASADLPAVRGDLGGLAAFKARWNARALRDKVPELGDLSVSQANGVDQVRAPTFDLGAPVTLSATVDHGTQALTRVSLTIESRGEGARRALRRAIAVLLDAIHPEATAHQHQIAELSLPSGASGSADLYGGYTIFFESTERGGGAFSIVPTTAERVAARRAADSEPVR